MALDARQAGAARGRGGRRRRSVQRAVLLVLPAVLRRGQLRRSRCPLTRLFDLRGVAFAAWTLAAFAIGVLAGMLIRRVVPAIVATLAVYAGLALATGLFLRQHYLTPLVTSKPEPARFRVGRRASGTTKDGQFAFPARGSQLVDAVMQLCPGPAGPVSQPRQSPAQCLAQHGYTQWTSYQPGSRFWPFQWIEGGWLLALSVLLIAATVWLVRRRAT